MIELTPTARIFNLFVDGYIKSKLEALPYVAESSKHGTKFLRDLRKQPRGS